MTHMRAPLLQAVVGAGAAGLASVRELLREGHKVKVFEQGSDLGGIWVYSDDFEEDLLDVSIAACELARISLILPHALANT